MLASSSTISYTPLSTHKPVTSTPLLLRGTRDGDLAATLSSPHPTPRSERTPLFTWSDLTRIVSTGSLQSLSRHPDDLSEYFAWMDSVKASYGSVTAFLLSERFTASKLLESASSSRAQGCHSTTSGSEGSGEVCFRRGFKAGVECQILRNDWPYSIPRDATHHVVWSYLPILHPSLTSGSPLSQLAWSIISRRGLCGTLHPSRDLTVPTLEQHAVHLPELNLTRLDKEDRMVLEETLRKACGEVVEFVRREWDTARIEVAFFANPPSLQSVPNLAHFHVLVEPL